MQVSWRYELVRHPENAAEFRILCVDDNGYASDISDPLPESSVLHENGPRIGWQDLAEHPIWNEAEDEDRTVTWIILDTHPLIVIDAQTGGHL